ncbi:VWA domain-containing protein [Ferruginivarius sediminum]|uniref:VWA domain-containing protein n=2 Tax=Ferruginivarius sediminum TaxID=2661937 RepID=A0A369TFD0_9PROT|nr:VWA domain-containing protein [Ferruginivarius sediminum]
MAEGRLVENLMLFARTLRAAGMPVGPGRVLEAIRAMQAVGLERRDDLYWALHAVFVNRKDQQPLFDQAFHVFWRNPRILERLTQMLLPEVRAELDRTKQEEMSRRLAEAMQQEFPGEQQEEEAPEEEYEFDAALTWSNKDVLQTMDFEKMSRAEMEEAKRAIERLRLPVNQIRTRRFRPHHAPGRADMRRSLREALRAGRDSIPIKWRRQRRRPPPLVIICDVSGSMAQYSRMVLHFMHAVTNDRDRVHAFVFGTRLTNITRYLRTKDVDEALEKVGQAVTDWQGGTRIGQCLHFFNRDWSRRVLGQGAVVLLITDGLDRDNAEGLQREMERLHKSCRRLIWLNPLLRYEGYAPKSQGAQAMMPHVDEFRSVHNLESLRELADALSRPISRRQEGVSEWLQMIE